MEQTTLTATGEPAILIEPKDLRIGNILSYKGDLVHVTLLSLDIDDEYEETIGFCKLGETSHEHADWNRALVADLKMVPLSSERLEQYGFEKDTIEDLDGYTLKGRLSIFLNSVQCIDGRTDWYTYIQFNVGMEFNHLVTSPPQYLHQVQNLIFALTGSDLK